MCFICFIAAIVSPFYYLILLLLEQSPIKIHLTEASAHASEKYFFLNFKAKLLTKASAHASEDISP
jgi:hypothetical protein